MNDDKRFAEEMKFSYRERYLVRLGLAIFFALIAIGATITGSLWIVEEHQTPCTTCFEALSKENCLTAENENACRNAHVEQSKTCVELCTQEKP